MSQHHLNGIGLCHTCIHQRRIQTSKGSVFYLCTLSERDARFAKYPHLPMAHCVGYERQAHDESAPQQNPILKSEI